MESWQFFWNILPMVDIGELQCLLYTQVSSAPSLSVFPDAMVPPLGTEREEIQVSSSSPLINTTIPPSQQQTTVLDNRSVMQCCFSCYTV